ncbi:MAG TPA: phosphatase PAP2 family protein, partial [Acidimicrobiia bacterium]|nr:phosphatase PAP2 family protein [Acidimicrobiia bacterium]
VSVSRSRWRWLAVTHATLTVFVVTVTANHWLLDGIVAAMLLGVAVALEAPVSAFATSAWLRFSRSHPPALTPDFSRIEDEYPALLEGSAAEIHQ